ncbi:MAG TPA: PIG-L deacetylase family protein [Ignavibacteria bacterium]
MEKKKKTLLAIAAHPDDLEFGCSMIVRKLINEGYTAYYLIATTGENGCKKNIKTRKERIEVRRKEQLNAAKKLGVKEVIFWNERDGFLEYTDNLRKKLTLIIKKIKPEYVFTFDPANQQFDNLNLFHKDHRIISLAAFDACFAAKNDFIYPSKYGLHRVNKIFFFGSDKPNFFLNISKDIDIKLDILSSHTSQFSDFDEFTDYFKKFIASDSKKYKYSESFRVIDVIKIT